MCVCESLCEYVPNSIQQRIAALRHADYFGHHHCRRFLLFGHQEGPLSWAQTDRLRAAAVGADHTKAARAAFSDLVSLK